MSDVTVDIEDTDLVEVAVSEGVIQVVIDIVGIQGPSGAGGNGIAASSVTYDDTDTQAGVIDLQAAVAETILGNTESVENHDLDYSDLGDEPVFIKSYRSVGRLNQEGLITVEISALSILAVNQSGAVTYTSAMSLPFRPSENLTFLVLAVLDTTPTVIKMIITASGQIQYKKIDGNNLGNDIDITIFATSVSYNKF